MPAAKCRERGHGWLFQEEDVKNPTLIEICVGLEINGYLPAEF